MKITFFAVKNWEKLRLKKALPLHQLLFFKEEASPDNIQKAKDAEIISVFIYSQVDAAMIAQMPHLKMIATRSTGFDHIDLKAATKRGIYVCNVPSYGENTVAEHTFALILTLSRNIHKSYVRTLRNDFSIEGLIGFDLKNKTIGVVGTGPIGLHVIKIAKGFGMNVIAFDIQKNEFHAEILGFRYVSLEELFKSSDILSLHVPYNTHTHHLINRDNIHLIKKGALLINTARGGLIDTVVLLDALESGQFAGAGLDVLEGEQLIKEEKQLLHNPDQNQNFGQIIRDHVLMSHENVVFTPHIAFYSQEALQRILDTTTGNILGYLDGHPTNLVK